ncbi:MAG: tRNA pseudouridine(38-40) synthase TruA [Gloeomargaritaceae cyanobacterium C42_A2020_066]|nr:tRNA pseudouridine(38-40) synthase TruA [Gloeomargaritaceae cyanobacterium C42_A2020_066]
MTSPLPHQRIALLLQYWGRDFCGWQRQPRQRSVQEVLEQALKDVIGAPVSLYGAGRTDTGVHAAGQVAHFDAPAHIPADRWAAILNQRLPGDVVVRESVVVPAAWHARFSAVWRRYRYTLYVERQPNLFVAPFTWHYYYAPLDVAAMQAALTPLLGRHHLAAFHRSNSGRDHSWVEVQGAECIQAGAFVQIEVQANAFLYGMMRLLVGMLVEVGRGWRSGEDFTALWQQERRQDVKYAAPARGLSLIRVGYTPNPFQSHGWTWSMPTWTLPQSDAFTHCCA